MNEPIMNETTFIPPKMMTINEVAKTGLLKEDTLRRGVREGWIPCIKSGNRFLINYNKLVKILEEC